MGLTRTAWTVWWPPVQKLRSRKTISPETVDSGADVGSFARLIRTMKPPVHKIKTHGVSVCLPSPAAWGPSNPFREDRAPRKPPKVAPGIDRPFVCTAGRLRWQLN